MDEIKKESVKCSECGKFFNKDFGMCPFCGAELEDENVEFTDNQDTSVSANGTEEVYAEDDAQSKFVLCPKCGNYYDENVGLCIHCGYSVFESDEDAEESENADNFDSSPETASDKPAYNDSKMKKTINYKKIGIIAAVVVCIVIVLSVVLSSPKITGVSMKQIETDIAELSYIKNGIMSNNTAGEYIVNEITLDKRQKNIEQKNDIIYCCVNISNELYESDVYVKLIYNLYNGGIWSLDENECIREESTSKPLKCAVMSELPERFKEFYVNGSHEIEVQNIQYIKDDNLVSCDVGNYTYKQTSYYKIVSTDGIFGADIYIDYFFSPSSGWTQITRDYFVDNYEIQKTYCLNPDEIFGNFRRVSVTIGRYQEYLQFYNYNPNDNTINYTYTNESNQKINGTAVFDIMEMSIIDEKYAFYYDIEFKIWRLGGSSWSYDMAYDKIN